MGTHKDIGREESNSQMKCTAFVLSIVPSFIIAAPGMPQDPTSRGCLAITPDNPFVLGANPDADDKAITEIIQTDTELFKYTWKINIALRYDASLMNALTRWDRVQETAFVTIGMPFMRLLYNTGRSYGPKDSPGLQALIAGAAVRAVLFHEFAHVYQFAKIQDPNYGDPTKSKCVELEADAMAAATFKLLLGWEDLAIRAAHYTFFSLGRIDYNSPDPHGFYFEREIFAELGMRYITDRVVSELPFSKIHKEQFCRNVLFSMAGATSHSGIIEASNEVGALIAAYEGLTGPELNLKAEYSFDKLLGVRDVTYPSLHIPIVKSGFDAESSLGRATRDLYAAKAKLAFSKNPSPAWREAMLKDLMQAQAELSPEHFGVVPQRVTKKLLLFGNHEQRDRMYIVTQTASQRDFPIIEAAAGKTIERTRKAVLTYIDKYCAPDEILLVKWDSSISESDSFLGRRVPFKTGKYLINSIRVCARSGKTQDLGTSSTVPDVPIWLASALKNDIWWIADVEYVQTPSA
jgi:hypothetical protein